MISADLYGLADDFDKFRDETVELSPQATRAIALALRALGEQAENLERTVVPFAARVPAAPPWGWGGNVVPLRQQAPTAAHADGGPA